MFDLDLEKRKEIENLTLTQTHLSPERKRMKTGPGNQSNPARPLSFPWPVSLTRPSTFPTRAGLDLRPSSPLPWARSPHLARSRVQPSAPSRERVAPPPPLTALAHALAALSPLARARVSPAAMWPPPVSLCARAARSPALPCLAAALAHLSPLSSPSSPRSATTPPANLAVIPWCPACRGQSAPF